jgi:hypothetical protein
MHSIFNIHAFKQKDLYRSVTYKHCNPIKLVKRQAN